MHDRGRFQVGQIGDHSAVLEVHSKERTRPSVVRSGLGHPGSYFIEGYDLCNKDSRLGTFDTRFDPSASVE